MFAVDLMAGTTVFVGTLHEKQIGQIDLWANDGLCAGDLLEHVAE